MQEREEQDDCSMRVVPREIEWIVPSRSIVTKYSGTGTILRYTRTRTTDSGGNETWNL